MSRTFYFMRHAVAFVLILPAAACGEDELAWPFNEGDTPRRLSVDPYLPVNATKVRLEPEYLTLWIEALSSSETDLRREAAIAIARTHRNEWFDCATAAPALLDALDKTSNSQVQTDIARALIAIDAREFGPELQKRLKLGPHFARVVEPALARWNNPAMRDVWLQRLELQAGVRRFELILALQSLGETRESRASSMLMSMARRTEDSVLRLTAAEALGLIERSGLESTADELLNGENVSLFDRMVAARLLRHHDKDEAIERLLKLTRDPEPAVATLALERLLELDPALFVPIAGNLIERPDARIRELTVTALAGNPSTKTVRHLESVLGDPHPDVRVLARRTLRDLSEIETLNEAVIESAAAQLNSNRWESLEQSAILLGQLKHKPVADRLFELASRHDRHEVGTASAWALGMVEVPDLLPAIFALVESEYARIMDLQGTGLASETVLAHLVEILGRLQHEPAIPHLKLWLPTGLGDPKPLSVRSAAAWSIGRILTDRPDAPVSAELVARVKDPMEDPSVVYASAIALGWMKSESAMRVLRPLVTVPIADPLSYASAWADNRTTGRPLPPMSRRTRNMGDWFLSPIGSRLRRPESADTPVE